MEVAVEDREPDIIFDDRRRSEPHLDEVSDAANFAARFGAKVRTVRSTNCANAPYVVFLSIPCEGVFSGDKVRKVRSTNCANAPYNFQRLFFLDARPL